MPGSSELPNYESLGFKDVRVEIQGSVAIITLNRAKQRNSFSALLVEELVRAFTLFDRDDRIRVVVLTADPTAPAYCSGADISGGWGGLLNKESEKEGEHAHRDSGGVVTLAIFRCRKITIAAVNGHAVGVGMTALQLPFDFRFVWEGAKLAFPFVRRGIAPEAISSYLLPKLVGHSRASFLFLSGATVTPTSPDIRPLYHSILPTREAVLPAALEFARDLAQNTSQPAIAITKALIWRAADNIEEQHIIDSRAIRSLTGNNDASEGARAFKEKRHVQFTDTLSRNLPNWVPWWREIGTQHRKARL